MKKFERIFWISITSVLILLVTLFAVQKVAANNNGPQNTEEYVYIMGEVFKFVENNYVDPVEKKKLYEGALRGMFEALGDPYSVFMPEEEYKELIKSTVSGEFGGLGLYIQKKPPKSLTSDSIITDHFIEIISPIEGTPGYKAGLHAGDFITHINKESVEELTSDQSVEKLTGEPGSTIEITVLRNKQISFNMTLTRQIIKIPTVKSAMINKKTGYLRIINWTPNTTGEVKKALNKFADENYKDLIVDLRGNPGGVLSSVVDVADLFLSEGTIVSTRGRSLENVEVFTAKKTTTMVPQDMIVIVLIDKGSASASEIFSGAIKDSGRGVLIGETTYGKGSVQLPQSLPGNCGFKLTTARYYTPANINIDKVGISPTIEVKEKDFSETDIKDLQKIFEGNLLSEFSTKNKEGTDVQINTFISELRTKDIKLDERILRKLIRNEYTRNAENPPIYDLEYDLVLQRAINELNGKKLEKNSNQ